ncbi:MAG: glycoside hydrolase family 3 N-terminal domain-containing protein [Spirochaetales bacterium]|nr:glycoside hydrolase family 3 N-terminal domain-containing protein [Spirochaetales bacterium]
MCNILNSSSKFLFCFIFFSLALLVSCGKSSETETDAQLQAEKTQAELEAAARAAEEEAARLEKLKVESALHSYLDNLTLDEKIAQLFAVGIDGNDVLHSYAKKEFANGAPGSFLLFDVNIAETAEQTLGFTNSVMEWFSSQNLVPPFFMIDNEGGGVYRFGGIGSKLLSPERMTACFSPEEAEQYYYLIGCQMKAMNIHLNLAPLVEVKNSSNEAFLGRRSYGSFENVEKYGAACIKGFDKAGVGTTLKHFPGNTDVDPHIGLPHLDASKEEVESLYIAPFKKLGPLGADAVLISHIVVDSLDEGVPSCFSAKIVGAELKESFWNEGLVISDDLYMGALSRNGYPPEVAVVKALKAGIDVLMISEKRFSKAAEAIKREAEADAQFTARIDDAVLSILRFKIKRGILELRETEDGSGYYIVPVPLADAEKSLESFSKSKEEADKLYVEHVR